MSSFYHFPENINFRSVQHRPPYVICMRTIGEALVPAPDWCDKGTPFAFDTIELAREQIRKKFETMDHARKRTMADLVEISAMAIGFYDRDGNLQLIETVHFEEKTVHLGTLPEHFFKASKEETIPLLSAEDLITYFAKLGSPDVRPDQSLEGMIQQHGVGTTAAVIQSSLRLIMRARNWDEVQLSEHLDVPLEKIMTILNHRASPPSFVAGIRYRR